MELPKLRSSLLRYAAKGQGVLAGASVHPDEPTPIGLTRREPSRGTMTQVTSLRHRGKHRLAVATLVVIIAVGANARRAVELFEHWAAMHALPLRTVEPGGDVADLRQLASVIGMARVVALGEPAHGAHEPLRSRQETSTRCSPCRSRVNRVIPVAVEAMPFEAHGGQLRVGHGHATRVASAHPALIECGVPTDFASRRSG
jgi:hypothetical protein